MTRSLGDLLSWGKERLKAAGVDDFDISAEILLRSILGFNRSQLILNLHNEVPVEKEIEYKGLIEKRSTHIPLQYLTGLVEFYNIGLKTDNRALIPRPETEILIETVLNQLSKTEPLKILDIGTGAGNIAIALAKNLPKSHITSVDISQDTLDLAAENIILNGAEAGVSLIRGDIFDLAFTKTLGLFDCVVSNPPYVASSDRESLQPEVAQFEPAAAIFAGDDPLIFFKTIVANILYILKNGGILAFEVGLGQAEEVRLLMKPAFEKVTIIKDLAGLDRVVTGVYAGTDKR